MSPTGWAAVTVWVRAPAGSAWWSRTESDRVWGWSSRWAWGWATRSATGLSWKRWLTARAWRRQPPRPGARPRRGPAPGAARRPPRPAPSHCPCRARSSRRRDHATRHPRGLRLGVAGPGHTAFRRTGRRDDARLGRPPRRRQDQREPAVDPRFGGVRRERRRQLLSPSPSTSPMVIRVQPSIASAPWPRVLVVVCGPTVGIGRRAVVVLASGVGWSPRGCGLARRAGLLGLVAGAGRWRRRLG